MELINVIGIIPARFNSSRFPGKALALLQGKPLIQHTFERAKECRALDKVIVATDDLRIMDAVHLFGGNAIMTSSDCETGTDRLAEAAKKMPLAEEAIVVNIQGDEPLIEPDVIQRVVEELKQDGQAVMATAITTLDGKENDPHCVKCVRDLHENALYFSRAPLKGAFKHIGLYAYRLKFLITYNSLKSTPLQLAEDLEQLKVLEHGFRIKTALVESASIGVDTKDDLEKVEKRLCSQNTSSSQAESAPR